MPWVFCVLYTASGCKAASMSRLQASEHPATADGKPSASPSFSSTPSASGSTPRVRERRSVVRAGPATACVTDVCMRCRGEPHPHPTPSLSCLLRAFKRGTWYRRCPRGVWIFRPKAQGPRGARGNVKRHRHCTAKLLRVRLLSVLFRAQSLCLQLPTAACFPNESRRASAEIPNTCWRKECKGPSWGKLSLF